MTAPAIAIRRYATNDDAAIARLNERLAAGGSPHVQYRERPEEATREAMPRERLWIAHEGDEVRGGVYLREGPLRVGGEVIVAGWPKYPVSESLVNGAFAGIPAALMFHLTRQQANLVAVGLGGFTGPFAQLLARMKWASDIVPSFVLPASPARVAAELPHMRTTAARRRVAQAVRWSGAGVVAGMAWRALAHRRISALTAGTTAASVPHLDDVATPLWEAEGARYPVAMVRDATALQWLYPADALGLTRLVVSRGTRVIGWVVVQFVDHRAHAGPTPYGRLRVGVLHDWFGAPDAMPALVAHGLRALLDREADLVIAQGSHAQFVSAARQLTFRPGPPTFAFARSPGVERKIAATGATASDMHVTRGDDGLLA